MMTNQRTDQRTELRRTKKTIVNKKTLPIDKNINTLKRENFYVEWDAATFRGEEK